MENLYNERKKWFLDRVGKKIYRDKIFCDCSVCKRVENEGVFVLDKNHALYLLDIESISNDPTESNHPIKYRDEK
jgi:hypothetical protein